MMQSISPLFQGARKSSKPKKIQPNGSSQPPKLLDFKVNDLAYAVTRLTRLVTQHTNDQAQSGKYGWQVLSRDTGEAEKPFTNSFHSILEMIRPLSEAKTLDGDDRDLLNLGVFLLLNQNVRVGQNGPLLFKQSTGRSETLTNLEEPSAKRVLTQFLNPEVTIVGGAPLMLTGVVSQPPRGKSLESILRPFELTQKQALAEAARQKKEQLNIQNRYQKEQQALASRQAAAEKQKKAAEHQKYRADLGLDQLVALGKKRQAAAKNIQYPNQSKQIAHYQSEAGKIDTLLKEHATRLNYQEAQRLRNEVWTLRQKAEALQNIPKVAFKIENPDQAWKALSEDVERVQQAQVKTGSLQYTEPLRAYDNKGFYDGKVALWQAVTARLQSPRLSALDESVIDLGIYILFNALECDRMTSGNYSEGYRLKSLYPQSLKDVLSGNPEKIIQHSGLQLAYPTEAQWERKLADINKDSRYYTTEKVRQESQIKDLQWAASPEGKAEIQRRAEEDRRRGERQQREHDEIRRERENRESDKRFYDAWR